MRFLFALLFAGCTASAMMPDQQPQVRRATYDPTVVTVYNAMPDPRACSGATCTHPEGATTFWEFTGNGCLALAPPKLFLFGQQSGTMQGELGTCTVFIQAAPNWAQGSCSLEITPTPSGNEYSIVTYVTNSITDCSYVTTPSGASFTYSLAGR